MSENKLENKTYKLLCRYYKHGTLNTSDLDYRKVRSLLVRKYIEKFSVPRTVILNEGRPNQSEVEASAFSDDYRITDEGRVYVQEHGRDFRKFLFTVIWNAINTLIALAALINSIMARFGL